MYEAVQETISSIDSTRVVSLRSFDGSVDDTQYLHAIAIRCFTLHTDAQTASSLVDAGEGSAEEKEVCVMQ